MLEEVAWQPAHISSTIELSRVVLDSSQRLSDLVLLRVQLLKLLHRDVLVALVLLLEVVHLLDQRLLDLLDNTLPLLVRLVSGIGSVRKHKEVVVVLREQEGGIARNLKILLSANLVVRLHLLARDLLEHLTDDGNEEVEQHDDHEGDVGEPDGPDEVNEEHTNAVLAGIVTILPVQVVRHG